MTKTPSEAIPADVLAMKEACKRAALAEIKPAVTDSETYEWNAACEHIARAIDKLSPEVKAEGGRGEPVAWQYKRADGKWCDCWEPNGNALKTAPDKFRPLYTHPAPDVEAIRADERERCAREVFTEITSTLITDDGNSTYADHIASAIRTGGQK